MNDHAIHAMIGIRDDVDTLPDEISESYYNSVKVIPPINLQTLFVLVHLLVASLRMVMRERAADGTPRNYWAETKRNATKQSLKIQNVQFICDSYENLEFENCLIYCLIHIKEQQDTKQVHLITINSLIAVS